MPTYPRNHNSHSENFSHLLTYVKAKTCGVYCMQQNFPAMDLAIVTRSATDTKVWCLLLEMKYEDQEHTPSVTKSDLERKLQVLHTNGWVKRLKTEGDVERVIMVFVLWRHGISSLRDVTLPSHTDAPDAILVLGQQQLNKFYASLRPHAFFSSRQQVPSSLRPNSRWELHCDI